MSYENAAAEAQAADTAAGEKAQSDAEKAEPQPGGPSWATPSDIDIPTWAADGRDNDADYSLPTDTDD